MAKTSPKQHRSAADYLPDTLNLDRLAEAAQHCQGCDLYKNATQAVFGEGARHAGLMMIGEQPGDQEDLTGKPFVGPAGRLLDDVLLEVGIPRDEVYVTNAVKHFKWTPRGKRRLHGKPTAREVAACRPWLEMEIRSVQADMIVCLGATAAQSLLGSKFRITQQRGEVLKTEFAHWLLATWHPSAILRAPDPDARAAMRKEFTSDLMQAARQLKLRR
jgi:DNA polymerase